MAKKETNDVIGFQVGVQTSATTITTSGSTQSEQTRNFGTIREIHDWEYDSELDNLYMVVQGFSGEQMSIGIKGRTIRELQLILRMETSQQDYYNFKNKNW